MTESDLQDVIGYLVTHLDQPLTLALVARRFGCSPAHFHRQLRKRSGESFGKLLERMRMHQAARHLLLHDTKVIDIALMNGYQHHETFSRAFARFYGKSPSSYRAQGSFALLANSGASGSTPSGFHLSNPRRCTTHPLRYISSRFVGPYEAVPSSAWQPLVDQIELQDCRPGPFVGIAWDAPDRIPHNHLRFDAGVIVPESFATDGLDVTVATLPASEWVVVVHAGAYASLPDAYKQTARLVRDQGYQLGASPTLEFYLTSVMDGERAVNFTEIYLPLVS